MSASKKGFNDPRLEKFVERITRQARYSDTFPEFTKDFWMWKERLESSSIFKPSEKNKKTVNSVRSTYWAFFEFFFRYLGLHWKEDKHEFVFNHDVHKDYKEMQIVERIHGLLRVFMQTNLWLHGALNSQMLYLWNTLIFLHDMEIVNWQYFEEFDYYINSPFMREFMRNVTKSVRD